ncbi:MAG: substrate-binding domain-containing protein [Planctomycetota bacterium]
MLIRPSCLFVGPVVTALLAIMLAAWPASTSAQPATVDEPLRDYPAYTPKADNLRGEMPTANSGVTRSLLAQWSEPFAVHHPQVELKISSTGSGGARRSLISNNADLITMPMAWPKRDLDRYREQHRSAPKQVTFGTYVVGVVVNGKPRVRGVSIEGLAKVLSGPVEDRRWSSLGVSGKAGDKPVVVFIDPMLTNHVLLRSIFSDTLPTADSPTDSTEATLAKVVSTDGALGLIPFQHTDEKALKAHDLKWIKVGSEDDKLKPITPSIEDAFSGDYPLSRQLVVSFNLSKNRDANQRVAELLRYAASAEGQTQSAEFGFVPLKYSLIQKQFKRAGLPEP